MGATITTNEAVTFELISKVTTTNSTTAATFSSIPQTYTDLFISFACKLSSGSADLRMRFNGNANTNVYYSSALTGAGSSINGTYFSGYNALNLTYYGYLGTDNNINTIHIFNYSNTGMWKNVYRLGGGSQNTGEGNGGAMGMATITSAITDITIISSSSGFVSGYDIALYGIKKA